MYEKLQKRKSQLCAEEFGFWVKKTQKTGFFGVFGYALEQFRILRQAKDAHNHKFAAILEAQGVETRKRHFIEKKTAF